jgi:hypothetical protein
MPYWVKETPKFRAYPAGDRSVKKGYDTFVEAERVARRKGGSRVVLYSEDLDPGFAVLLAVVSRDALGRLWTDLTWEGSKHA